MLAILSLILMGIIGLAIGVIGAKYENLLEIYFVGWASGFLIFTIIKHLV